MLRRQKHTMFRDRIGLSIETGADPSYKKVVTTSTPPSEQYSKDTPPSRQNPNDLNQGSKVDEDGHPVFELSPGESSSPEATSPSPRRL